MDDVLEEMKGSSVFRRRVIPAQEDGPSQDEVIITPRPAEAEEQTEEVTTPIRQPAREDGTDAALLQTPSPLAKMRADTATPPASDASVRVGNLTILLKVTHLTEMIIAWMW